jgi:hypothetical protein
MNDRQQQEVGTFKNDVVVVPLQAPAHNGNARPKIAYVLASPMLRL